MRGFVAAVTLVALLTAISGCSWLFVDKPPTDVEKGEQVSCTESKKAPITDVVLAAIMIISAVGIITNVDDTGATAAAGLYVGLGALFGVSAASGFMWTEKCAKLHDEYEESYLAEPPPIRAPSKAPPAPRSGLKGEGCRADGSCEPGLGCHQGRCLDLIK